MINFVLNGKRTRASAHPMTRLLDVLREECKLTGTKEGCGEGECGACTVLVDGLPVNSCLVPFVHVERAHVTTIEGLNGRHPLQRAFVEHGGAQCGICTPGMIMAAVALGAKPSMAQMQEGLAGNLCRCTGYSAIYRSIRAAGRSKANLTSLRQGYGGPPKLQRRRKVRTTSDRAKADLKVRPTPDRRNPRRSRTVVARTFRSARAKR